LAPCLLRWRKYLPIRSAYAVDVLRSGKSANSSIEREQMFLKKVEDYLQKNKNVAIVMFLMPMC
jgi:hypothetical protein